MKYKLPIFMQHLSGKVVLFIILHLFSFNWKWKLYLSYSFLYKIQHILYDSCILKFFCHHVKRLGAYSFWPVCKNWKEFGDFIYVFLATKSFYWDLNFLPHDLELEVWPIFFLKSFNIGHISWMVRDRVFIFHIHKLHTSAQFRNWKGSIHGHS
jgi:hypothetical protein